MAAARALVVASAESSNSAVCAAASANAPGSSPPATTSMNVRHPMTPASTPALPERSVPIVSTACAACTTPGARATKTMLSPGAGCSGAAYVPVQTTSITGRSSAAGLCRATFALTPSPRARIAPAWVILMVPSVLPTSRRSAWMPCSRTDDSVASSMAISTPPPS